MSTTIEIHLDPRPLRRKLAQRIKAAGGKYSEARGHVSHRFVHFPLNKAGVQLAHDLIEADRNEWSTKHGRTVILRNHGRGRPGSPLAQVYQRVTPDRVAKVARRFARWAAPQIKANRVRAAAERAKTQLRMAAADAREVNETSLEAGERLAAAFLRGAVS